MIENIVCFQLELKCAARSALCHPNLHYQNLSNAGFPVRLRGKIERLRYLILALREAGAAPHGLGLGGGDRAN